MCYIVSLLLEKRIFVNICSSSWLQKSIVMSSDGTIGKEVNYWKDWLYNYVHGHELFVHHYKF